MTLTKINTKAILMGIIRYISFVWSIGWRTILLSMIAAILCGVALGVVSTMNAWPPSMIETIAPTIGLPITLSVFGYVFVKQILRSLK